MTAINAYARGGRAYILTDTALYDHDGVIIGFGNKTFPLPTLGMAISTRGSYRMVAPLALEIGWQFKSFDAFLDHGKEFLAEYHDQHFDDFASGGDIEFDLLVAGYSTERRTSEAAAISSRDYSYLPGGAPAYTWNKNLALFAPTPPVEEMEAAGIMRNGGMVGEPVDILMKLIDLQRHMLLPCGSGSDHEAYVIGGQAVLTEIRENGVSQRVVKTWAEDKAGETIKPVPREAATPVPLNRQQRRAMARAGGR